MSSATSNRGNVTTAIILSLIITSVITVGGLILNGNGHITYNGHSQLFQNKSGTICLTNQTGSCGTGGSSNNSTTINGLFRNSFINIANTTQANNFTNFLNFYSNPNLLSNSHKIKLPTNASGTVCLINQTNSCGKISGGVTITKQYINLSPSQTTTSTLATIAHYNVTLPNRVNGFAHINFIMKITENAIQNCIFRIVDGSTNNNVINVNPNGGTNSEIIADLSYVTTLSGQVVKLQGAGGGSGQCTIGGANGTQSYITSLEISSP